MVEYMPSITSVARFWTLRPQHPTNQCLPTSSAILWLLLLITIWLLWAFILGSSGARNLIHRFFIRLYPCVHKSSITPDLINKQRGWAFLISFLLQYGATLGSATFLWMDNKNIPFSYAFFAFAARPQPGIAMTWASFIDWKQYGNNAYETLMVEWMMAFLCLFTFGDIWNKIEWMGQEPDAMKYVDEPFRNRAFRMVKAGSVIGQLSLVVMVLFVILRMDYLSNLDWKWGPKKLILGRLVHFVCCLCIWTGILMLTEGYPWAGWCPSNWALQRITILWAAVPPVEHVVRAAMVKWGMKWDQYAPREHREEFIDLSQWPNDPVPPVVAGRQAPAPDVQAQA